MTVGSTRFRYTRLEHSFVGASSSQPMAFNKVLFGTNRKRTMATALENRLTEAFPGSIGREGLWCECHGGWFWMLWRLSARLEELITQVPASEQE